MSSGQSSRFLVTLFAQDVGMYLCFNKRWKLMGFKRKRACARCHFVETMVQGYFRYVAADDATKFIGFRKTGKPLMYHRPIKQDESCYNFRKRPTNSTSKTQHKLPPLCVHNNNNNFPVNNPNKVFSSMSNKNRLRNTTISSRPKQKRKKHVSKHSLEANPLEPSLLSSSSYSVRKLAQSNATIPYSSNVNSQSNTNNNNNNMKNPKALVSKNTEKTIQNDYNENGNKFTVTPKHKLRHFHSRHHHAKRSPNQKGLEIEINL